MNKSLTISLILIFLFTLPGCAIKQAENNQQAGTTVGAGLGAGLGAALGQAIGRDTEATLLGAGIGALLGGVAGNQIGKYMDKQERDLQNAMAYSRVASLRREQDVLTATFHGSTYFDYNSAKIKPAGLTELQRVAQVINNYPQTHVEIAGHSDTRGPEVYNVQLSNQRAIAVRNVLEHYGVAPQRISTVAFGESQPISSNDDINRRVEIKLRPVQA